MKTKRNEMKQRNKEKPNKRNEIKQNKEVAALCNSAFLHELEDMIAIY